MREGRFGGRSLNLQESQAIDSLAFWFYGPSDLLLVDTELYSAEFGELLRECPYPSGSDSPELSRLLCGRFLRLCRFLNRSIGEKKPSYFSGLLYWLISKVLHYTKLDLNFLNFYSGNTLTFFSTFLKRFQLIKVHVTEYLIRHGVNSFCVFLVFFRRW